MGSEIDKWRKIWEERRSGPEKKRTQDDSRTPSERDYARIIHSAAFRRLQNKTQVLCPGESDFYRTRLTHSIEVAQIGASLAKRMLEHAETLHNDELKSIIPDDRQIQAVCLAHDIGNPPFGHGGEIALNKIMHEHGGFEGNGQTLRILSKLEKYSAGYGMDVTRRTLLGVIKYPGSHEELSNKALYRGKNYIPPKCYLDDDQDIFDWVIDPFIEADKQKIKEVLDDDKKSHYKTKFKSLDASIMELADDIAYGVHDLEDAISMNLIHQEDWKDHIAQNDILINGKSINEIGHSLFDEIKRHKRKDAIGALVHYLIINAEIKETDFFQDPIMIYNITINPNAEELLKKLKKLVFDKVINIPSVQRLEYKGQLIIEELFKVFESDPKRFLPTSTFHIYEDTDEDKRKRVICDYVSGMTDEYATKIYQSFFIPKSGSIFDR